MTAAKPCKDCPPGSKRPAGKPGPRCATHHRAKLAADKEARWEARILATYGITASTYWAIYQFQGGTCFMCERATGRTKRLAVDHDHATGRVRGLLCSTCNQILGHARDSRRYFRKASAYLALTPYEALQQGSHPTYWEAIG